ncbi:MAG: hypothetical protein LAT55_12285 [Opitutales bacterium]|nr:hypothetical protein [Opitutales bacterium]
MSNTARGYICEGTFKGFHQSMKRDNPTEKGKLVIGIEIMKPGKFGDESSMEEFTIPQPLIDRGLPARLHSFTNKQITVPFEIRSWSMEGRSGVSQLVTEKIFQYLDDGVLEIKPATKAA